MRDYIQTASEQDTTSYRHKKNYSELCFGVGTDCGQTSAMTGPAEAHNNNNNIIIYRQDGTIYLQLISFNKVHRVNWQILPPRLLFIQPPNISDIFPTTKKLLLFKTNKNNIKKKILFS